MGGKGRAARRFVERFRWLTAELEGARELVAAERDLAVLEERAAEAIERHAVRRLQADGLLEVEELFDVISALGVGVGFAEMGGRGRAGRGSGGRSGRRDR